MLHFDMHGHVAILTIDRPPHNAMNVETYAQLTQAWTRVRDDDEIWVAIVTATGDRAFTVGVDLKEPLPQQQDLTTLWQTQMDMLLNRGLEIWKPVIAAINGICVGGGLTMMLATDLRIAADHATFGFPEVKAGLLPGNGGTQRAVRQLPWAIAMEMMLVGERISAEEALRHGLVNKVVPLAELMPTALQYAETICSRSPLAVQATKELAVRSAGLHPAEGLRMEQLMAYALKQSEDRAESIQAFREKRKPNVKGR